MTMEERQQPIPAPPANATHSPKRVHSACPQCDEPNPERLGRCPQCGANMSRYVVVQGARGEPAAPKKRKQRTKKKSRVKIEVGDRFTYKGAMTCAVVRAIADDGHRIIYDKVLKLPKHAKWVNEDYNLWMSRTSFLRCYDIRVLPTPPALVTRVDDEEIFE
jgi:hypothetical protein